MKKSYRSLSTSMLVARLLKSGTGVIEGNFKSDLGIDDMKISSGEKDFFVHLSDFAGNYLGKYHVNFSKPKEKSIHCELLTAKGGVYSPLKDFADSICIILLPFENDLGGYAGRFIADWGGPTAEIMEKDLAF